MVRRTIGLGEEQCCLLFGNTGRGDSMLRDRLSTVRDFMHDTAGVLYHIVVGALSAAIALSLPTIARSFFTQ